MRFLGETGRLRTSVSVVALLFFSSVAWAEETEVSCIETCGGAEIGTVTGDPGEDDTGPDDGTIVIDDGWIDPGEGEGEGDGDGGWTDPGEGDGGWADPGEGDGVDPGDGGGVDPGDDGVVDPGDGGDGVVDPGEDDGSWTDPGEDPLADPVEVELSPPEDGDFLPEMVYTMADETGGPQVQRGHAVAAPEQTAVQGRALPAIPDQCRFGGAGLFGLCAANAP